MTSRHEDKPTRRTFLTAAGAALAGFLGPRPSKASARPESSPSSPREAMHYRPLFHRGKDLAG